jgi:hypothetical protein
MRLARVLAGDRGFWQSRRLDETQHGVQEPARQNEFEAKRR